MKNFLENQLNNEESLLYLINKSLENENEPLSHIVIGGLGLIVIITGALFIPV